MPIDGLFLNRDSAESCELKRVSRDPAGVGGSGKAY